MRKIIVTAAAVLALIIGAACSGLPSAEKGSGQKPQAEGQAAQGPRKFAVGEHALITLSSGSTADIVVDSVKPQGGLIVVTVTIQCTSGTVDYNPFDFSMVGGDSKSLDFDPGFDVPNLLHSGTLVSGNKITGALAFKGSPEQVANARVTYTPGIAMLAYWAVIAPAPSPSKTK